MRSYSDKMSKDERSLLLFFETCAVDGGGLIKTAHMNGEDFGIAAKWNEENFVMFGRVRFHDIKNGKTHWCTLSDDAWVLAHQERKNRAERMMKKQKFEKLNCPIL